MQPNSALQGAGAGDPTTAQCCPGRRPGLSRPGHFQALARQLTSSASPGLFPGGLKEPPLKCVHRTCDAGVILSAVTAMTPP